MAKRAYIGVSGKARKIKKGYIGVSGKARKIKKAYIGVGGKARPFWAGGTLAYYGTATERSNGTRWGLNATTVGNYAIFAGGFGGYSSYKQNVVDAYNASLTKTSASTLSQARSHTAAATVGSYAIFAGGIYYGSSGQQPYSTVDTYNISLTKSTATSLSSARYSSATTTIGNYALIGSTYDLYGSTAVDAYNSSLTRSTPTALSVKRGRVAAATVGSYALFAGGATMSSYGSTVTERDTVDTYNASLTKGTATALSVARYNLSGATVGGYALFAGGHDGDFVYNIVDAYNTSLTKTTPTILSTRMSELAGTTLGDYAIFGCVSSTACIYNTSLVQSTLTITGVDTYLCATSVGDYALFSGDDTTDYNSDIQAFVLS